MSRGPISAPCTHVCIAAGCSHNPSMKGVYVCLCALVAITVAAVPATEVKRDLGYDPYSSPGYPEKWQLSTLGECTSALRPLLAGLLIATLVKLPLLLLGKVLLLKAAAPLAVGAMMLPLGLYAAYRGTTQQQDESKPQSRLLSPHCLQAVACNLGAVAPKSALASAVWVMKMLEEGIEKDNPAVLEVSSYREAYLNGATAKPCSPYSCPYL